MFKKIILIFIVIGSMVLNGCSNGTGTEAGELALSEEEFPPSPKGYIKSGNKSFVMEAGGYKWINDGMVSMTDHAGPTQIAENYQPIAVDNNEILTIDIEKNPKLTAYIWEAEGPIEVADGKKITLPENSGQYIYEVIAKWSNGEVSYTFVVEVK